MTIEMIQQTIADAWSKQTIDHVTQEAVRKTIALLDSGQIKVCDRSGDVWLVNDWMRQAILLYMRTTSCVMKSGYYDKIPLKFEGWDEGKFKAARIRVVPGALVRYGAQVSPGCVLMPSFINIGAFVDENTMIDINAALGSCCYIGKDCHIGAGTVIGGVLEPLHDKPVMIGNNVFIGASCSITHGVIVSDGAVIAAGTHISQSTRIYDCTTKKVSYGIIPPKAVVVAGAMPRSDGAHIAAAIIVKYADAETRRKVGINELLRLI